MPGPGALKRIKELKRQEKNDNKAAAKPQRKQEKDSRPRADGEDPDIAHIIPGPQPIPEE